MKTKNLLSNIVVISQHSKNLVQEKVRELVIPYIKKSIPEHFLTDLNQKRYI